MTSARHIALCAGVLCSGLFAYAQDWSEVQLDTLNSAYVVADKYDAVNGTQTGMTKIDSKKLHGGFATFSTPDVIKILQTLPGVASGSELLSGLYVHGGDGSDNLFLLDGVPLYQVSHIGGLFSAFNTDFVQDLDFYKSGFPARYGGRLSSVVDVNGSDGDFEKYHGSISVGLIDGRVQFGGPIVKGRTSFNVAARRSWLDVATEPAMAIINLRYRRHGNPLRTSFHYAFYDINARITHRAKNGDMIYFNFYDGSDYLKSSLNDKTDEEMGDSTVEKTDEMGFDIRWGNLTSSVKWNHELMDGLRMSSIAYYTQSTSKTNFFMDSDVEDNTSHALFGNRTRLHDLSAKTDFDWLPTRDMHVRYGAQYQFHIYRPERQTEFFTTSMGEDLVNLSTQNDWQYLSHEFSLYAEDEWAIAKWFKANAGVRYMLYGMENKVWHRFEPRVALRARAGRNVEFKLSYTEMNQANHLVATTYLDLPTNCWMPSTSKVAPSHSKQVAGGVYASLPHDISISVEGYYKSMRDILEYGGEAAMFPPIDDWETTFLQGKGRSYGLELSFIYNGTIFTGEAYYTLSKTERFFEDICENWYPDRNDNRHKINIQGAWKIGERIDLSAAWVCHSGNRWTMPTHVAILPGGRIEEMYSSPYNAQMPAVHRLDLGFNYRKQTKRGFESIWNVSIYNVYCRMNPIMAYAKMGVYDVTTDTMTPYHGVAMGLLPIIPSFSYTLKF